MYNFRVFKSIPQLFVMEVSTNGICMSGAYELIVLFIFFIFYETHELIVNEIFFVTNASNVYIHA